jgi:CheY-like chemotaxis protein
LHIYDKCKRRKGDKRMKQAEHPPATAGASIAAEYSLAIIDQLARIDRSRSKEKMDELVYRLLSLIGEAMQSDRVFLFERLEGTAEAYCNTFEWCANGVAPQIDNLTEIVPADMPYWLKVFGRGETIVIPNIEDVKTLMPSEYELLKAQSIRSEIAVPVFYRGNLSGFFGLDNPRRAMTAGQLRLLAFDGGHLGSARENLRMLTLLEEKQKSLEQNLQAVKLEQQMLKVLCKDSTSVYRVDLMNDRAEIVKIEEHSNFAGDLLPHGQELFSYPVKDGNWHLVRFIVQTRGENGEAEQVLFAMRLYSEEKRREKDLMSAADAARRANEAKSEFLSCMSHDIRTPMNVIMGFTNIALQHADDPAKMKECLEKIQISGGNLQELIDDVLDISRIESVEFKIVSQPVKLPELFDFYCQAIAGMAEAKNIRFSGKLHNISHNVLLSDQIRLGQIYMNLLSNAVKYTPEKPLTVLVGEDNDLNYEITAEQLRGYRVHCVRAVNGQDCLQRIEQAEPDEFDAILMDMQMPVMNGLEATAAIRKLDSETAEHIPIIALTANAYHEDIQKCLAAGMNAHLSKPINIDRAVRTIIECARTAKENG